MAHAGEDDELETPVLRPLVWMGDSRRKIQAFPEAVRKIIGDELQLIQFGGMPRGAKPFQGVGSGVFEIAVRFRGDAFRAVVAVQLGRRIYVLHAFQKESKRGIATPKHEVDLIKQRHAAAKERAGHDEG